MGKASFETCTNAGFLKKAGTGLVMDIAGAEFFISCNELDALINNRAAGIVNRLGSPEGIAYLSPLTAREKTEVTGIISRHIYIIHYRRLCHVLAGKEHRALIREFHPSGGVAA